MSRIVTRSFGQGLKRRRALQEKRTEAFIEGQITELDTSVATIDSSITSLQTSITELDTRVDQLEEP